MFSIFKKKKKIKKEGPRISQDYLNFLADKAKQKEPTNKHEKFFKYAETLKLPVPKSMEAKLKEDIVFSTMNASPEGVFSGAILALMFVFMFAFFFSFLINDLTLMAIMFLLPLGAFYYFYSYPKFRAQVLKVQTGDEAIRIILYMVIYLKLHPNFEGAVNFAAAHSKGPLSKDIKKAMWDIQVGKYRTVEQGLSAYMQKWVIWNEDFVRSISLLYGVMSEPSEEGRERILRKSLDYLLTNTHRKMKVYVENISGPINILHVMGLLMPVMGLIMFPMISMFLHQSVNSAAMVVGYVFILPLVLYFFINRILLKRPSAFMVPDISKHPDLSPPNMYTLKSGGKKVFIPIFPLALIIGFFIMFYGLFHFIDLYGKLSMLSPSLKEGILMEEADMSIRNVLSTFSITFGFGIMFYLYFHLRSFQRIKIRNDIKNIEGEFQIGLFALGNYLSEGYPIEKAILKTLEEYEKLGMQKRAMFNFFTKLLYNIKNFSMTFKRAMFDEKYGIILYFPSALIEEVMRTLADASERSSVLLGNIAKTIGTYLEDLSIIEAKIRELLEDVRAGIKMQAGFVVPLVCAITGSLGIFMINMLKMLACQLEQIEKNLGLGLMGGGGEGFGATGLINELVGDFTRVMPMTVLQAVVGIYTIEAVALFAFLLNGIENGFDPVSRDYLIAKMILQAIILYAVVSILAMIMFHGVIMSIIESTGGEFVCT